MGHARRYRSKFADFSKLQGKETKEKKVFLLFTMHGIEVALHKYYELTFSKIIDFATFFNFEIFPTLGKGPH